MSDDDLGAAVPLDGDRLDALERLAEKATPGAWAVLDLADAVFDSEDNRGWWWVWRAGCEHYAGILEVQSTYKASAEKTLVGCSIGEAQITDATRGDVERADAEFIAATDPSTVLALAAALRASWAEVERLTGERRDLTSRLGFGDGVTEPQGGNDDIVRWYDQISDEAREWGESQAWRADCHEAGHPDDEDCYEHDPSLRLYRAESERDEARAALAATERTLAEIENVANEHAKGGYSSYHRGARAAGLDVLSAASRTGAADKENDR